MIDDNNIFDIEIEKYIKLNKGTKRKLSGIKSTVIQWPEQDILIDPYILGMWLGDGMQKGNSFSSDDLDLVEKWKNWGNINDILITKYSKFNYGIISKSGKLNNINHKYLKNPFKTNLEKYNLTNDKRIPKEYIINSRENRLKLLAGIVDTDGCVQDNGTTLVIVQGLNHSKLIEDIILLVKSLGFTCYHRIKNTQWKEYKTNNIKNGKAHHLHISGKLEDIPVLLQRKKGVSPKIKNVHLSNIKKIIPQEEGEYIGFELDRNNRFLLGDFTVTHNCKLEAPKINVEVKQADINKLLKWSVIEEINDIIKMKEMSVLKKSEKKKKGYTKIEGLDPANNAGGKLGYQCSLILCEGLSAKTYAVAGIQKGVYDKAGRDWYGCLPLRGKCTALDTPILLWNGQIKKAQDIKVGDILVNDMGEQTTVLELFSGTDTMYEVQQLKGDNYTVNSEHTLTLKIITSFIQLLKILENVNCDNTDEIYSISVLFRDSFDYVSCRDLTQTINWRAWRESNPHGIATTRF